MRPSRFSPPSHGRTLTTLLVTLVVIGLAGAVVVLLSELNARTYTVEVSNGTLSILKGRLFPVGTEPFRPADASLQDAYAPLDLLGRSPGALPEARFTERDELDRALFTLMESLARGRVTSDDPRQLDQGISLLHRMERLPGITQEQRVALKSLQAEVSYYQARVHLDEARREIAEALAELKIAGDSASHNSRSAHQMVVEVEPAALALEESLRRAVHVLSVPGNPPPSEAPAPPAQPPPAHANPPLAGSAGTSSASPASGKTP